MYCSYYRDTGREGETCQLCQNVGQGHNEYMLWIEKEECHLIFQLKQPTYIIRTHAGGGDWEETVLTITLPEKGMK